MEGITWGAGSLICSWWSQLHFTYAAVTVHPDPWTFLYSALVDALWDILKSQTSMKNPQNPPGQNACLERRELPEEYPCPVTGRSMLEYYNNWSPFPWLNLQPPSVWAGQSSPSNTAWALICPTRWTRTPRPPVCVHWHKDSWPKLSSIWSWAKAAG